MESGNLNFLEPSGALQACYSCFRQFVRAFAKFQKRLLVVFLRCVIPVELSDKKNKLNGIYVYRQKHNYIVGHMFTNTKAQLHVSAFNFGHLQVLHEELINKLYQRVWGV
jgi:hypothetical protein